MKEDTQDAILMAEEIGRLKQELRTLQIDYSISKDELKEKEKTYKNELFKAKGKCLVKNTTIITSALLLISIILMLPGYAIYMAVVTDNKPTHCEIKKIRGTKSCKTEFELTGIVEWGSDIDYGKFDTEEQAINHANINNCKLGL